MHEPRDRRPQRLDCDGLVDDEVHAGRHSPAASIIDPNPVSIRSAAWAGPPHMEGQRVAVHARHGAVGDDDVERLGPDQLQRRRAVGRLAHLVPVEPEVLPTPRTRSSSSTRSTRRRTGAATTAAGRDRGRVVAPGTGNRNVNVVPRAARLDVHVLALHDPVDHREAEARAPRALRGEERLEKPRPDRLRHADAGVAHHEDDLAALRRRLDGDAAAVGHRVDRVEQQVRQRLAQFRGVAGDRGDAAEPRAHLDRHTLRLLLGLPAWLGEPHGLRDHAVEFHRRERLAAGAVAVELAQPVHDAARVARRRVDEADVPQRRLAVGEPRRVRKEQLREPEDTRERVVEVVRDPARHGAQRPQALLADVALLRRLQLGEGLRQPRVRVAQRLRRRIARAHVADGRDQRGRGVEFDAREVHLGVERRAVAAHAGLLERPPPRRRAGVRVPPRRLQRERRPGQQLGAAAAEHALGDRVAVEDRVAPEQEHGVVRALEHRAELPLRRRERRLGRTPVRHVARVDDDPRDGGLVERVLPDADERAPAAVLVAEAELGAAHRVRRGEASTNTAQARDVVGCTKSKADRPTSSAGVFDARLRRRVST
jgi:hypothetical protein